MTRQSANDISTILRNAPLPSGLSSLSPRHIAYKTGTSFGFRDAWAFGSTPSVTIGVWVGRADGTPRPGAFARETAAPLLFRLFDLLPEEALPAEVTAVPAADPPASVLAPALHHLPARDGNPLLARFPRIVYPPPGAILALGPGQPVTLEAAGGVPPYRWAINGIPLKQPLVDQGTSWQPDGPGYLHVTLTDGQDHSVQEDVLLQWTPPDGPASRGQRQPRMISPRMISLHRPRSVR